MTCDCEVDAFRRDLEEVCTGLEANGFKVYVVAVNGDADGVYTAMGTFNDGVDALFNRWGAIVNQHRNTPEFLDHMRATGRIVVG